MGECTRTDVAKWARKSPDSSAVMDRSHKWSHKCGTFIHDTYGVQCDTVSKCWSILTYGTFYVRNITKLWPFFPKPIHVVLNATLKTVTVGRMTVPSSTSWAHKMQMALNDTWKAVCEMTWNVLKTADVHTLPWDHMEMSVNLNGCLQLQFG